MPALAGPVDVPDKNTAEGLTCLTVSRISACRMWRPAALYPWGMAEGAVVFALTAALHGQIVIHEVVVQQSNFGRYPMVKPAQAPLVETYFVKSEELPTGVGEPCVPPLAPGVANALFALTGKRLRSLPLVL